jgi:excisionase family DNA binding protein
LYRSSFEGDGRLRQWELNPGRKAIMSKGKCGDSMKPQLRIERIWSMPDKWTFAIKPIKQLTSDKNHLTDHKSKRTSPYLDAQEAAEYLGINVKSLYGLVERRQLEPLRGPKRTYRFTKELLDEYLKSRR